MKVLVCCVLVLAATARVNAVDMFLRLDGISGESQDTYHRNEIDIQSISWGVTNPATVGSATGGITAGKAVQGDVQITKYADKATTKLFSYIQLGTVIPTATITLRKPVSGVEFQVIRLGQVFVTGLSSSTEGGNDRPVETLSLKYVRIEETYRTQGPDGKVIGEETFCWDVARFVRCVAGVGGGKKPGVGRKMLSAAH